MKKISLIIGSRTDFIKALYIYIILGNNFEFTFIDTGQYLDLFILDIFGNQFEFYKNYICLDLDLVPTDTNKIDNNYDVGELNDLLYVDNIEHPLNKSKVIYDLANIHNNKLGKLGQIRERLEKEFEKIKPDVVIVFGNNIGSLTASVITKKLSVKLFYIKNRVKFDNLLISGDFSLSIPKKINGILIDHNSDYCFVSEPNQTNMLKKEETEKSTYMITNILIDCLHMFYYKALETKYCDKIKVNKKEYILVSINKTYNTDNCILFKKIFFELLELSNMIIIVFIIYPKTKINLEKFCYLEIIKTNPNIILEESPGYLEYICLISNSKYVITDSDSMWEITSELGIQCFTSTSTMNMTMVLKNNTIIDKIYPGTNKHIDLAKKNINLQICEIMSGISSFYAYGYKQNIIMDLNIIKNNSDDIRNFYCYNGVNFLCKLSKKNKNLIFMFHGAISNNEIGKDSVIFRGYNYTIPNTDIVCVSDFLLYKFTKKYTVSWSLCTKFYNSDNIYKEIFSYLINLKKYKNVIFTGTSAGGFPSIKFASYFNSIAIISNSQLYIENYKNNKGLNLIKKILDKDDKPIYQHKMIEQFVLNSKPKKIIYYQNQMDDDSSWHSSYNDFLQFKNFINKNNLVNICEFNLFNNNKKLPNGKTQHNIMFPDNKTYLDVLIQYLYNI